MSDRGELQSIPVDLVRSRPYQPRRYFDTDALAELAESIVAHGLIQPITVTRIKGGYELIAGERRWRAAQ